MDDAELIAFQFSGDLRDLIFETNATELYFIPLQYYNRENTLTIGEAGKMLTFNTLFVWVQFVVVFWVASLSAKPATEKAPDAVPVPAQQQ